MAVASIMQRALQEAAMLSQNTQAKRSRGEAPGEDESMAYLKAVDVVRNLGGGNVLAEEDGAGVHAFRDPGEWQDLTNEVGRSGIRPARRCRQGLRGSAYSGWPVRTSCLLAANEEEARTWSVTWFPRSSRPSVGLRDGRCCARARAIPPNAKSWRRGRVICERGAGTGLIRVLIIGLVLASRSNAFQNPFLLPR